MDGAYKLKQDNPKLKANIISKLFFAWTVPLFYIGSKRSIQLDDLYKTLTADKSEKLGDKLEKNWNKQVENVKNSLKKKPSLLKAIIKTFMWEYLLYGLIHMILNVILRSPQPLVLAWLVKEFETTNEAPNQTYRYILAGIVCLISLVIIFMMHHANFGCSLIGMRVRIAASSLIYRKIMKLNKRSQGQTATGQVINILSNDVQRFDQAATVLHWFWIAPIQVALVTYIMWGVIGIYCLVGVVSMFVLTIPLQTYLGKLAATLRVKVATRCDTRVKHMSEIISGIQVIKMYAWEKPFEKLIEHLRAREISALTTSSYLRGFYSSCNVFIERLTLFLTMVAYSLAGYRISADIVFSMAQFFNILQLAMAIMYPMAVSLGAESWVALKRLEEILMLDEKEESVIEKTTNTEIKVDKVTAAWVPGNPILKDIELKVPKGKLCAVIGPVGAGKTSILQLLLGELPPASGIISIGGSLSYSSQEPWLFAASVRKNILFGKAYEPRLYHKVVKVCALEKDFDQFPYGDKTMVGERGVSLSGGQRARINLARAIYRQADIYLLDDPLSAVDTHVGKHLFEECIVQYLGEKTRVLVTHQLQYLKKADFIVVLNEGKIEAQGTFEELSNSDLDFTKLLAAADESQDDNKKDQEFHVGAVQEIRNGHVDRKVSILSLPESNLDQTIRDDDNEEKVDYGGSTPLKDYFKAVKNVCLIIFVAILFILSLIACTFTDYWVAYWSNQEEIRYVAQMNLTNESKNMFAYSFTRLALDDIFDDVIDRNGNHYRLFKKDVSIYIYIFLICTVVIFVVSRALFFYKMAMKSSKNIHKKMFGRLLEAPMRFFDTNPSGRVLNRFSKDMGAIDEVLPRVLMDAVTILLVMTGILINVIISNYFMVIALVVLGSIFIKLRNWYIASAKDIKHLEGIAKSPVFSHIGSTLNGLTTIRASQAELALIEEFDDHQDVHTSAWYFTIMCVVSFGLWLDIICVIFTCIVTFGFVVAAEFDYIENGSLVGLAISQSLILTGMLQHGMRQTAEVINQLTSVDRVMQYTKLENEGPFITPKDRQPKEPFPRKGDVEFRNMNLIYVRGEPPVLKNLNIRIKSGEKVGIVGRTGAGKSSLIAALFHLAPIEGNIFIDEVDTKTLGLSDLRKKIAIIPQEPVLFSASLRYNLDPFGEFDDRRIWEVLEEVELKDVANSLDFQVSEGGGNFSVGQRQLLCLARALLRNNKILVLDEATANVDARTDGLIQTTIRRIFKNCTVLTIAHRLNTIMDSDKVLVMGSGQVLEFDHPHVLLQKPDSHFLNMVQETGASMTEQLREVALQAWIEKGSDGSSKK